MNKQEIHPEHYPFGAAFAIPEGAIPQGKTLMTEQPLSLLEAWKAVEDTLSTINNY